MVSPTHGYTNCCLAHERYLLISDTHGYMLIENVRIVDLIIDINCSFDILDARCVVLFWVYSYELFSLPGLLFYNPGTPIIGVGVRLAGEDQQGWGGGLLAGFFLVLLYSV